MTVRFAPLWRRVADLEARGVLPDWMIDRQARARATRERVLTATTSLLADRPFGQITMEAIAAEAEVSIGALYARFPSKEAVLGQLGLAVFADVHDRLVRALDAVSQEAGLCGVVGAYIDTLVTALYRFRSVVVALRASAGAASTLGSLAREANHAIHEVFLARAAHHTSEIAHGDPSAALQWILFATNAAARESILTDALSHYTVPGGRRALRDRLTQTALAYLLGESERTQ
jgi:AcrR family transcriptional regulator